MKAYGINIIVRRDLELDNPESDLMTPSGIFIKKRSLKNQAHYYVGEVISVGHKVREDIKVGDRVGFFNKAVYSKLDSPDKNSEYLVTREVDIEFILEGDRSERIIL